MLKDAIFFYATTFFFMLSMAPQHQWFKLFREELSALCCYREDCLLSACMCARMREREISSLEQLLLVYFLPGVWAGEAASGKHYLGRADPARSATFKSRPTRAHAIGTFHHQPPQLFRNNNLHRYWYLMIGLGTLIIRGS
jgi:hypothetical protein